MKRRFIAGAVCPECRALDRIVVETDAQESRRSCVECGFSEVLDDSSDTGVGTSTNLPPSRLLRPAKAEDVEPSPVRLIDPKKPSQES